MAKDYQPILPGDGDTDYARYMRIDALLSLQRSRAEMVHRDELLFQTVHQSTELWLKHACYESADAADLIRAEQPAAAVRLLARAGLGLHLVTEQLEMMHHLAPRDFNEFRAHLGNGSGFESPGWQGIRSCGKELADAFDKLLAARQVDLHELYLGDPDDPVHRLAEAMIEWDERVALWRVRHYKIATRIIGHGIVGTKGTPVDVLARLIAHKFFPALWAVRTGLTLAADGELDDGLDGALGDGLDGEPGGGPDGGADGASCPI
ncbi:tryptophan 2,3-dioxygenase family protein [Kitasatospora kifunensis]|uniref:Tryptophan 2,3-dioxygenase n=1 Tax=Kitasatospora kifunensis TaxID=58351 RepID=A0A7W7QZ08_KITKI|nr:tryptophan 2,3-dioxygenase family protein [Kitasatospora kifunensis]MBB4922428.1 tryptophan 2,3-dioxygenase [Kitasatospora kifunensis]